MHRLETEGLIEGGADIVFTTFADAEGLHEFMPGVVASRIISVEDEDDEGPLDYQVDVRIGLGFFSGSVRASVALDREDRSMRVRLLNGPVKSAQATVGVQPEGEAARVRVALDYQPSIGPIEGLIRRFQDRAVTRVMAAYAQRVRALQAVD